MEELFRGVWEDLVGRVGGPLKFRLILQPSMAAIFAILAGLRDAREGRSAYFWTILVSSTNRRLLLREGWQAVAKIFILAAVLDGVYQLIALRWVYPGEALIVAFLLAFVPYLLIRGPVNRISRRWLRPGGVGGPR